MTAILHLTLRSLAARRFTALLTLATIALSVSLLLGVERVRSNARTGFTNTVSGTDLIVGARSAPVPLLLSTVFHIGNPPGNIRWESVEALRALPAVAWVVPISLGDSHRGYRVVGTDAGFFRHLRYAGGRRPVLAQGRAFSDSRAAALEAVLGAEVAATLSYGVGARVVIAHGAGEVSFVEHAERPFRIVGVLERTGTPIDRAVLVSLHGMDAIHEGWPTGGAPSDSGRGRHDHEPRHAAATRDAHDGEPRSVSAALVGLHSRSAVLGVQQYVNRYPDEPLLGVLPGPTLQELWGMIAIAERALFAVSALVVAVGLAGLVAVMVAGLSARRRELAILRALGAGPGDIFLLLASESLLVTFAGCLLGTAMVTGAAVVLSPWVESRWGWALSAGLPGAREWTMLLAVLVAGLAAGLVPAWRAYRWSLADGMTVRH